MRKKKDEIEEVVDEENDSRDEKKARRKEGVERRKSQKKLDRVARWSGFILLLIVIMIGFLMWVAGEMRVN